MRNPSFSVAALAAVGALGCAATSAQATPTTCGGPGQVTVKGGPTAAIGKPCSIPFKVGSQTFNGCVSVNVIKPAVTASVRPFKSTDYWCATTPTYSTSSKTSEKEWGFCECEYEIAGGKSLAPSGSSTAAPSSSTLAPTNIVTVSTAAPTLMPSTGGASFETSGGYVAENSVCWFPLTVNGQTFTSCVPLTSAKPTNKGKAGSGTPPSKPKTGTATSWCFVEAGANPNGTAVDYSSLPKATQVNWGYCRSVTPTAGPSTLAPTTAAPTASIPVTTGGYAKNATKCVIPFVYKNAAGVKTTINTCASYTQFTPFVNKKNLPTQPQPPYTNATWCYTGPTGVAYDPTSTTNEADWGFCAVLTTAPTSAVTPAPSAAITTVPTGSPPTFAPSSAAPSAAPSHPPTSNSTTPVSAPTNAPSTAVKNTTAPSAATKAPTTMVVTVGPSATSTPTMGPTVSSAPTGAPQIRPSAQPTKKNAAGVSAAVSSVAAAAVAVAVAVLAA